MKQTYFARLTVNKQGVSHTLLIPVTQQAHLDEVVSRWQANQWTVEVNTTPYPGLEGMNASEVL